MKSFIRVWLGISFIAMGIGLALLFIAVASGAKWKDAAAFSNMHGSYEGVENINFELNYGDIKIERGDTFSISAENVLEDQIEAYVKDGTWYIRENDSKSVHLFGWKFPINNIAFWEKRFTPDITITIPEGFQAGKYDLHVLAGKVNVEEINASEGNIKLDAGDLNIDKINITEKSSYAVGAGDMYLRNVLAKDVTMSCGMGRIETEGIITGDNFIKTGMGNIELTLNAAEEDYSYEISCGIGAVVIDNHKYNSITNKVIKNEDAEHNINLDCGIGDISVDFK